jgi:hypothetical protein
VFVLVDRTKSVLFPIPKRAFPDAASQDWFRTQATQFQNSPAVASQETFVPGRFATSNGIALTIKLGYWDYFNRSITSWRMRGMFLAIIAFMVGVVVFTPAPPHAVNSPEKTLLIMLPIFTVMMGFVIAVLSFISWRAEKKCLDPQHIVINEEGVEFAGRDITGRLP